jgi:hypothetical protein
MPVAVWVALIVIDHPTPTPSLNVHNSLQWMMW